MCQAQELPHPTSGSSQLPDRAATIIHTSQLRKLGSRDSPSARVTRLLNREPTPTPTPVSTRACLLPWAHVRPADARSRGLLGQAGRSLPCSTASSKLVPRPARGDWQVMAPHLPKEQIQLREGTTLGQTDREDAGRQQNRARVQGRRDGQGAGASGLGSQSRRVRGAASGRRRLLQACTLAACCPPGGLSRAPARLPQTSEAAAAGSGSSLTWVG